VFDVDNEGRIYGGFLDGRIIRFSPNGENIGVFANTKGRPLGLDFDNEGNLIIADAVKGLLSVDKNGAIEILATEIEGIPLKFTDDVDVGPDNMIYFSDASEKFGVQDYRSDLWEHRPHGKIIRYDPSSKKLTLLLDGLYFANGVAVSPNGQFLLFNETYDYSVSKYWLQGPKAGTREKIFTNMPGFPDGISTGSDGIFWIAIFTPRNAASDALSPKPFLRKIVFRLPLFMQPAPVRHGFVLGIDENGNVIHNLQDPDLESYSPITSVEEENGVLYLGSLIYPGLARIKRPQ
jgi:sugar lactone lactonase YvrE